MSDWTIEPYLVVSDADAAIDFYRRAFGAEEALVLRSPDGGRVLHATLRAHGAGFHLSEDLMGGRDPKLLGATPVTIHLIVPDIDAAMAQAAAAGATVTMPAADMFWGDRHGTIADPFGHAWSFSTPLRQPTQAELDAGAAQFTARMAQLRASVEPVAGEVKALLFDVFGTVVNWRDSIAAEAEAFFGPRGLRHDWHRFADRWRERYQPAMEEVRAGRRPWTKLDVLHRENLVSLLDEFAIHGLGEAEIDHLNTAWHRLQPWPDAVAGLRRLKRRFTLATQSNGNIALMVNMAKHAGLPWDVVLGAEIVQAYKPQPEAYDRAVAALGLDPRQCMMVAAHNGDLVAARSRGMRTAFVARPTEYGPNQTKDMKAEHDFDVIATDFVDLAACLGC